MFWFDCVMFVGFVCLMVCWFCLLIWVGFCLGFSGCVDLDMVIVLFIVLF